MASANRIAHRRQAITRGITNQRDPTDPKRIFENEDDIRFGHRSHRNQADRTLDTWVDRVARLQNVPQHDLGDGRDRGAFEIEIEAVSARRGLRPRLGDISYFGALENHRLRPRTA